MNIFKTALLAGILASAAALSAGNAQWLDNFEKAKTIAKDKSLPILADFTGSDWCPWCMKLDEEVFSQKEFKEYASQNLILMKVDFPRTSKLQAGVAQQNDKLAETYGVEGFPTIILISSDGKVIAQTGYMEGGAAKYVESLKELLKKK